MIAALESHRGKGLGNLINAAILHRLKKLEFKGHTSSPTTFVLRRSRAT